MIFEDVNFSIEEELEIVLIKGFNVESHMKGYYSILKEWSQKKEEILNTRLEPENAIDKFVLTVKKEGQIVTYAIFTQK